MRTAKKDCRLFLSAALTIFLKLYNKSYFEAGRSKKIRSLLGANEEFSHEPDAKRALFDNFNYPSRRGT